MARKRKPKDNDGSSFFNVGDRVKPKGAEGYATGTVVTIEKGIVTIKPDFRLGESTTCSAHYDRWQRADNDPKGNTETVVKEPTSEKSDNILPERVVAEAVAKARWKTLKVTETEIADDIGTTEQQVIDVVASEDYLTVIRDFFREYKSWQTWAKKLTSGRTTITKMADRLWISEDEVTKIVSDIVGITL